MKIAEIFYSIQGEGLLTGVPSAFVRTSGCPLRCWYCDTDYTSWHAEGENLSVEMILTRLAAFPTRHAVLTGGEPFIAPELPRLCQALRQSGYHITIETAAIALAELECDLVSLSPKLRNSTPHERESGRFAVQHEQQRLRLDVVRGLMERHDYQLKFVIDQPEDVDEVRALLDQLPSADRARVLLMPQGVTSEEIRTRALWLVEECKQHGFRYCPRLHIDLFGHRRGT